MTNTITLSIPEMLVKKVDELRKSSNISRSGMICKILSFGCDDEELIRKVLEKIEDNTNKEV